MEKSPRKSAVERAAGRAYTIEVSVWMSLLIVAVFIARLVSSASSPLGTLIVSLLPAVPAAGIAWAVKRHLNRIDEYQRSLLYKGCTIGFAAAMLVTIALMCLTPNVIPASAWMIPSIYLSGMLAWSIAQIVFNRQ